MTNNEKKIAVQNRATENLERPVLTLKHAINNIFDDWFDNFFSHESRLPSLRLIDNASEMYNPRVDVSETATDVIVTSELPGLQDKDIDVVVTEDAITIKGEKKEEKEEKKKDYYRQERYFGSFERSVPLPCEVKTDKANAIFKNGVLTVTLPKSPAAQQNSRHIAVKSA